MIRILSLPAQLGAGYRHWLSAGLLGACLACSGTVAMANTPDDAYTQRLVAEFSPWIGNAQDTEMVVHSLQSGQAVGAGAAGVVPATGALSYGEARLALKLAQNTLAQEGIVQPNAAQLQAALHGGPLETANGSKPLPGILPQRAQGQTWGAMAQSAGMSVEDLIPPKSVGQRKASAGKKAKATKKTGKASKSATKAGVAKKTKAPAAKAVTRKVTAAKKTGK